MRTQLQLKSSRSDDEVHTLLGKKALYADAPLITTSGDVSVFKPDGTKLCTVLRGSIPTELIDEAFPFMYEMRHHETNNRGAYAGSDRVLMDGLGPNINLGNHYVSIKKDGTTSRTKRAALVRSTSVGFLDRSPRIPYCRQTAYSTQYPEKWGAALPFIQHVSALFQQTIPDRYAAQLHAAKSTHPAFVIPATAFTTITVNNTVAGAFHTDKGDFKPGFGAMVVFRRGHYRGAEFVFPKYGIGADLQHGDIIFFDPHEVHGNIPFHDTKGREAEDYVRISMVFYFRQRMVDCLEPKAEVERAKALRGSLA